MVIHTVVPPRPIFKSFHEVRGHFLLISYYGPSQVQVALFLRGFSQKKRNETDTLHFLFINRVSLGTMPIVGSLYIDSFFHIFCQILRGPKAQQKKRDKSFEKYKYTAIRECKSLTTFLL